MSCRLFHRADWICGAIAMLIAFAVYAFTTAPSVTLLDSGEFLVAAQHFGVPHPTGYPIWTFLAWLFHFLPLGNMAWRIALFSGVCGALAVGLATMLIRNGSLWMLSNTSSRNQSLVASICAISMGLVFAFSFSMWSQAVIVEVYTLQALLVGIYLLSLYGWLRHPEKMSRLYWSFFTLSLAFCNHQLALALAPLPFLAVLFIRRDLFWDFVLAVMVCILIAYLSFALFSNQALVIKAAIRLGYLVLTILVIALIFKRGRIQWKLVAFLPLLIAFGLLPYIYLPLASNTNPPMNWGYTKTSEGFFASFNRSQYPGSLSEKSLRVFSKVLGVPEGEQTFVSENAGAFASLREFLTWSGFFWMQLLRSFSPFALLFFLGIFCEIPRGSPNMRAWIGLLLLAFILAMGLQPVLEHARTDNSSWWVQMPYHTYTNFIFSLICGIGACFLFVWLIEKKSLTIYPTIGVLLALPVWPLIWNIDGASQRDHWLGWQYGRDMLSNLPRGSIIFGGTDPGRFIPTYLIFGESSLPPQQRVDPTFDRRDLYIITQNGLTNRHYLSYIRDHYAFGRPKAETAFERWLHRDRAYPGAPLLLPTIEEMQQIRQQTSREVRNSGKKLSNIEINYLMIGAIAKWIFEKNKDHHAFFVEEHFPMKWSYDYAIPEGLLYRINPEPLAKLPEEAIKKDLAYWAEYVARLKANPIFAKDYDAQRSFSRLRLTGGRIYEHWGRLGEAEIAYRQAVDLWIGNLDALTALSRILWNRQEFDEVISLLSQALQNDPNSLSIRDAWTLAVQRKQSQIEINGLLAQWRQNPQDIAALRKIVILYSQAGEDRKVDEVLIEALPKLSRNLQFLSLVVQISEAQTKWQQSADAAKRWIQIDPKSPEAFYALARAQCMLNQQKESLESLRRAIDIGGAKFREQLLTDSIFQRFEGLPDFDQLISAPLSSK